MNIVPLNKQKSRNEQTNKARENPVEWFKCPNTPVIQNIKLHSQPHSGTIGSKICDQRKSMS